MQIHDKILNTIKAITTISNNTKLDFQAKLQGILKEVVSTMNTEQASLMLVKGKTNLEVAASINQKLIGIKQPIRENSPSSWVVKNKQPLYVNNKVSNVSFKKRFGHYKKGAFLLAPILSNNKVIGVLSVTEKIGADKFSAKEQSFLMNIAGIVISAIDNNRLAESLKQQRLTLHQKNTHLKKLEKLRTELFNMLVHDLKGPISEVVANLDILSYTVDENNHEYVDQAQSSCDVLYRMIVDLLDIARMEEGSLNLIHEKIKPQDLINEATSLLLGLAKKKEITIQKTGPSSQSVYLSGDKGILSRVLQNLLVNAIYHSPHCETIDVGFDIASPKKILFFVKDNGPGVPKEYQEAIFEKFVQLQKKKDGRIYSTGLGLTFCKMAIELHNGTIQVESDGKNGSRFIFALPSI